MISYLIQGKYFQHIICLLRTYGGCGRGFYTRYPALYVQYCYCFYKKIIIESINIIRVEIRVRVSQYYRFISLHIDTYGIDL